MVPWCQWFEGVCVVHTHVILAPGAWNLGLEAPWMARFRRIRWIRRIMPGAPAQSSGRLVFEQHYSTLGTFGRKMGPQNPENWGNFKGGVQGSPIGARRHPKWAKTTPNDVQSMPREAPTGAQSSPRALQRHQKGDKVRI